MPPPAVVEVKLTMASVAQTVSLGLTAMLIDGVTVELTTIYIAVLPTVPGLAHGALLVSTQRTESPLDGEYV